MVKLLCIVLTVIGLAFLIGGAASTVAAKINFGIELLLLINTEVITDSWRQLR